MNDADLEQLLQRARSTAPRAGSKDRLRSRILSAALASGVGAITTEAAGAAKASALLGATSKSGSGLLLSVLGCVAGGTAIGLWLIGPALSTDGPAPRSQSPSVVAVTTASMPALGATEPPLVDTPPTAPPSPTALPALSLSAESPVPSIERETALLAEAARALGRNDAAAALGFLDLYDAEFPRGALSQEASAQRIVSWCSLGRKPEGQLALGKFRTNYPGSPLLSRVTAACGPVSSRDDFELESAEPSTQSSKRVAPTSATGRKLQ